MGSTRANTPLALTVPPSSIPACSFGVELTINNIIVAYMFDQVSSCFAFLTQWPCPLMPGPIHPVSNPDSYVRPALHHFTQCKSKGLICTLVLHCLCSLQFGLSIEIAGIVGAVFGLMNIFCRSLGGWASDFAGKYFGMRGRLWAYFLTQVRN